MKQAIFIFNFLLTISYCQSQNQHYDSLIAIARQSFELENYKLAAIQFHSAFNVLGRKGYAEDRYQAAIAWTLCEEKDSAFYNLFRLVEKTSFLEYHVLIHETGFQLLHDDIRWTKLMQLVNPNNEIYNDSISKILLVIRENDQKYRKLLDVFRGPYNEEPSDSFKSVLKSMNYFDSINIIQVCSIIDQYGWLSHNEVGRKANSALWLVIQHAELKVQEKYFPIMKAAVKNGRASKTELAYLEDRILMYQGKKQLYGTQYRLNETYKQMELWEIVDPENLNKRRESVGLPPM